MSPSPSGATGPTPDRPGPARRGRLQRLHEWAPGQAARPIPVALCFLMAASSPADREAAAAAHRAQAEQLTSRLPAALADAYQQLNRSGTRPGSGPSAPPRPWPSC